MPPTRRTPWLLLWSLTACTGFHEVSAGAIYRDRQPAEDELVRRIEQYGIGTVVQLRGPAPAGEPSQRAALATGTDYVAIPLSASQLPPPERLLALWNVIDRGRRPLFFHCRAGVDRTGLACALAVLHDTDDLAEARGQLSLLPYGHTGLFGTGAMDEVLDRYEPWHQKLPFPNWVQQVYTRQLAGETVAPP